MLPFQKKEKEKKHNTVSVKQNAFTFLKINTFHKPVDRLKIGKISNNRKARPIGEIKCFNTINHTVKNG